MGRIGRRYPRFEEALPPSADPGEAQATFAFQVAGAVVGVICALALIGWLLSR